MSDDFNNSTSSLQTEVKTKPSSPARPNKVRPWYDWDSLEYIPEPLSQAPMPSPVIEKANRMENPVIQTPVIDKAARLETQPTTSPATEKANRLSFQDESEPGNLVINTIEAKTDDTNTQTSPQISTVTNSSPLASNQALSLPGEWGIQAVGTAASTIKEGAKSVLKDKEISGAVLELVTQNILGLNQSEKTQNHTNQDEEKQKEAIKAQLRQQFGEKLQADKSKVVLDEKVKIAIGMMGAPTTTQEQVAQTGYSSSYKAENIDNVYGWTNIRAKNLEAKQAEEEAKNQESFQKTQQDQSTVRLDAVPEGGNGGGKLNISATGGGGVG